MLSCGLVRRLAFFGGYLVATEHQYATPIVNPTEVKRSNFNWLLVHPERFEPPASAFGGRRGCFSTEQLVALMSLIYLNAENSSIVFPGQQLTEIGAIVVTRL